jgi:hypothetical protein
MRVLVTAACTAGLLLSAGRVAAQQKPVPLEKTAGFDIFTAAVSDDAAQSEGTASRMWGGQFNFGVTAYRVLNLSAEAGVVGIRDRRSFTEDTNLGEKTSSVGGVVATVTTGLRTPPLHLAPSRAADVTAGINGGYTFVGLSRDITYCVDCTVESVKLHAGVFWEPAVQVYHGKGGVSARYRVFAPSADVSNALMIGYTLRVGPRPAAESPAEAPAPAGSPAP